MLPNGILGAETTSVTKQINNTCQNQSPARALEASGDLQSQCNQPRPTRTTLTGSLAQITPFPRRSGSPAGAWEFSRIGSTKIPPQRGWAAERRKLFLVSVANREFARRAARRVHGFCHSNAVTRCASSKSDAEHSA